MLLIIFLATWTLLVCSESNENTLQRRSCVLRRPHDSQTPSPRDGCALPEDLLLQLT